VDLRPRTLLQRLNGAATPDEADELAAPAPAAPAEPAPIPRPAPAARVRGGARLPDWWAPKKPLGEDEPAEDSPADDEHEHGDHEHEHADEDEDAGDEDGPVRKAAPGRRWSMSGSGKKTYNRPVYGTSTSPKKSLMEAWGGLRPATRHGLYNGTALAIAWQFNVPQFFTQETAYLVHTHHSWTSFEVCIWYGVAIAICALDHRTRNWLPPFALLARTPLISLVVGVLLYGNPL
jgi:hypothetical protein